MRRILVAFTSLAFVIGISSAAAFAQSPHFITAGAAFQGSGPNLVVTFKEAGLGNNQLINYTASANATAEYACINGGGNHPKAANKETVSSPVSASGTFSSGKNGNVSASLTLSPPGPGSFSCPPGQTMVLGYVSYTNVAITDTTNNVSQSITGTYSRTFYTFS